MKRSALVAGVVPSCVTTEILTGPTACAGAVAKIEVAEVWTKDAVVVPKRTLVAVASRTPVTATLVPPPTGPLVREMAVMTGP